MDVCVDTGRSHVLVARWDARGDVTREHRTGGAGLGDVSGVAGVAAVVQAAVSRTNPTEAAAGDPAGEREWRLAVALPGVETDRARAVALADLLGAGWERPPHLLVVVSDAIAWQVGAFAGGDGVVLAVGTGAVAISREGARTGRGDGFGLLLGDDGGGAWIGREALRAAVRGHAELAAAGDRRCGPAGDWPGLVHHPEGAALLASLVPDVLELAAVGEPVANGILDRAAGALTATLDGLDPGGSQGPAASRPATWLPVSVVGGLGRALAERLHGDDPTRRWVAARGDACDGARLLLERAATPFEASLVRVGRGNRPQADGRQDRGRQQDGQQDGQPVDADATDRLPTEGPAPDVAGMDSWPTERLVQRLVGAHAVAQQAARYAVPGLARAADAVAAALSGSGRLVYVGAGTPGRLAVQDAAELTPTFGLTPGRALVLLAGGQQAAGAAVEDAEDDVAQAARDVDTAEIASGDVVLGISASGRTPYVLAALHQARQRGALTVGIACVPGSELSAAADIGIDLPTGPEVLAGSTRLAAGTAQKIALNTISTAAMVRSGATYGPWMVDVQATNAKLRRRAVRMVRDVAGLNESAAEQALAEADGSVKVALVMRLSELDAGGARDRLAATGSVRAAVARGDNLHRRPDPTGGGGGPGAAHG